MTLKEKFKQWLDTDPRLQIREVQLEVIAEEFAIGFADWIANGHSFVDDVGPSTTKELLEIFKKEKGL
jgi:hypothetical protein